MADALRERLISAYQTVRHLTDALAAPLSAEDQQIQSMPDASPTKWHRAHTTWFFETFVLGPKVPCVNPAYATLFNSYYEAVGPRHPRPARGLLTRPSCREVDEYRRVVDGRVIELLSSCDLRELERLGPLVELGLAHEQQHQELLLTDILHALSCNPLLPRYRDAAHAPALPAPPAHTAACRFIEHEGGLVEIGARDQDGFCFDNERPRHRVFIEPFAIATRLATVGEMKAFIAEGGYDTPALWLSEGLDLVRTHGWNAPLHARFEDGAYLVFGLDGLREAGDAEPVSHLSFYEADALARFLGAALPTEFEWELFAHEHNVSGNLLDSDALRPLPATESTRSFQLFGDVWEWTRSAYEPYPGFATAQGALGEYNGKFMVSQLTLRGGSCFTPQGHIRPSYRNFWHPHTRFQMSGLRVKKALGRM